MLRSSVIVVSALAGLFGQMQQAHTQSPSSDGDILAELKSRDAVYRTGLTATGIDVSSFDPLAPSVPPLQQEWKMVLARHHRVLSYVTTRGLECDDSRFKPSGEPVVGSERAYYIGPEFSASISLTAPREGHHRGRNIVFAREGSSDYVFMTDKVLWSLGRGFSDYMERVESWTQLPEGTVRTFAAGKVVGWPGQWTLVLDPAADHMVRSAKFASIGKKPFTVEITTSGLKRFGLRALPESAVWKENNLVGRREMTVQYTIQSASADPDVGFADLIRDSMRGPYHEHTTTVADRRADPPLQLLFVDGELTPTRSVDGSDERTRERGASIRIPKHSSTQTASKPSFDSGQVTPSADRLHLSGPGDVSQPAGASERTTQSLPSKVFSIVSIAIVLVAIALTLVWVRHRKSRRIVL